MSTRLYWKGHRVSQKQYNKRLSQQQNLQKSRKRKSKNAPSEIPADMGKRMKSVHVNECSSESMEKEAANTNTCKKMKPGQINECESKSVEEEPCQTFPADSVEDGGSHSNRDNDEDIPEESLAEVMEGRRIIEYGYLGKQMWCYGCKEALAFQYIVRERRKGLGSILIIRCHKCLLLNEVKTSKTHSNGDRRSERFDVNSKSVLGALHSGMGWSQLDKLFAMMNIPCYNFHTFKRYENEIGLAAEDVAKESCKSATLLEREMTIEQATSIEKSLPVGFQTGFLIPSRIPIPEERAESEEHESSPVTFSDVVRVMASYDMGWSTRGAGRSYDSLNGFGAIIGHFSGQVLDYATCNRKCKGCNSDMNHPDNNCRRNFCGSAKTMEPHVGKQIIVDSEILKSQNVEVGILVGDDDSSIIAACRQASDHPILKQSDRNHASGGVKKQLYKIEKNHKELRVEAINYLHRCFTYALAQNAGDGPALALTIRSIPHHAFNNHSICGAWCGYYKDKENYEHHTIPDGFKDPKLFEALKKIFDKLADNAEKFSLGASSNRNESLNATMASKAPKSRCYSMSASADYRFACSVGQKNLGETYTQEIAKKIDLSPGKHHLQHIAKSDRLLLRRKEVTRTKEYKTRRIQNKQMRSALRHVRENHEGVTYASNCALLTQSAVPDDENDQITEADDGTHSFILFDLETSSLGRDCDILQIAAMCGDKEFSIYVNPRQQISSHATAVTGLVNNNGTLLLNGKIVPSVPIKIALENFLAWIEKLGKKAILIAHNLIFDGPRLYNSIKKYKLEEKFANVTHGFLDTLPLIRSMTGKKGKGECTLGGLAKALDIVVVEAHNAIFDCKILSKILAALKITTTILLENVTIYGLKIDQWNCRDQHEVTLTGLKPMENILSITARKKLAAASITLQNLQDIYSALGVGGIQNFLTEKINNGTMAKIQKKTIQRILQFFSNEESIPKE